MKCVAVKLQFFPHTLLSTSQNEMSQTEMKQSANRGLLPFVLLPFYLADLSLLFFVGLLACIYFTCSKMSTLIEVLIHSAFSLFPTLTVSTQKLLHLLLPLYVCCTTMTKNGPFQRHFHYSAFLNHA